MTSDHSGADSHTCGVPPEVRLLVASDTLDRLEALRQALSNQYQSLTSPPTTGEKGGSFGKAVPADHPAAVALAGQRDAIAALEHQAVLELQRAMRLHPLGPWVKRTVGVGEKQAARLLAVIGDPGERRTVSQLWAYCGFHVLHPGQNEPGTHSRHAGVDPSSDTGQEGFDAQSRRAGVAPKRKRGEQHNWNDTARSRARLIAESCIKQAHSPYRAVYDTGRAKYAECDITDLHKHNRALRLVAKAVLRDMWIESRRATA